MNRSPDTNQSLTPIIHRKTGQNFSLYDWIYAALSADRSNPLSVVSIANSSLSVDLVKGCSFQCAYCHAQSSLHNLDSKGMMLERSTQAGFTEKEVLDALIAHPFFVPWETVISIGTATTEPFWSKIAIESTKRILEYCIQNELHNPIWIVTKAWIPKSITPLIRGCTENNIPIIIALTYSWLDNQIEPIQNNRFKNGKLALENWAKLLFYLRPIVEEWWCTKERIDEVFSSAYSQIWSWFSAIVPWWLRWTEWIEYWLQNFWLQWPSSLTKEENQKEISDDMKQYVAELSNRYFPNIPVLWRSSCWLSVSLKWPNLSRGVFNSPDCIQSLCTESQRRVCALLWEQVGSKEAGNGIDREINERIEMANQIAGYELGAYQIRTMCNNLTYQLLWRSSY